MGFGEAGVILRRTFDEPPMPNLLRAGPHDCPLLLDLMAEFYAESGHPVDRERARAAFSALLADRRLGQVWLIHADAGPVGYVVLTLGYSMEYGGPDAFVDDLFIQASHRGRGLGKLALAEVRAACIARGVRALHLEVGRENDAALSLYRGAGFVSTGRELMTLRLATT
jgi:ribosomal protein S18 acetylase RimI-like enzyme